ncbi:hypothetical protein N0O92_13775 [Alkalihalobacillus sp. MEB130]|uniref:hypothetical protein n=1 Tax=Alkalihalobacillus sp. MEB130 TaxID=2976704 RepID=UPI0028E03332|nr:hypothetical protein [Alkalihalobacillus sp. MEB130]MDT8861303.1 hypothetical protein [Alkalihalobacillus sp. MEB130]
MVIHMTDAALCQLKTMLMQKEMLPRIDAKILEGPKIGVTLQLVFDEYRKKDEYFEFNDIVIRIDRFTVLYIEGALLIDFSNHQGFTVYDSLSLGDSGQAM